MSFFIASHLFVLGLLIFSKWHFWAKKREPGRYLTLILWIWISFFLLSILFLWLYIGHADFLVYFAIPFLSLIELFHFRLIGFSLFLLLFLFAFFFLPIRASKKQSRRTRLLIWKYYLSHLFLYFSLLPGILLAFAQVSFYGQESPGIRDAWIWNFLFYFPAFWAFGMIDAWLSAKGFWRKLGEAQAD